MPEKAARWSPSGPPSEPAASRTCQPISARAAVSARVTCAEPPRGKKNSAEQTRPTTRPDGRKGHAPLSLVQDQPSCSEFGNRAGDSCRPPRTTAPRQPGSQQPGAPTSSATPIPSAATSAHQSRARDRTTSLTRQPRDQPDAEPPPVQAADPRKRPRQSLVLAVSAGGEPTPLSLLTRSVHLSGCFARKASAGSADGHTRKRPPARVSTALGRDGRSQSRGCAAREEGTNAVRGSRTSPARCLLRRRLASAVQGDAHAAFPGLNGRIAYIGSDVVVVTTLDRKLTFPLRINAYRVAWSPQGRRLLVSGSRGESRNRIWLSKADGWDCGRFRSATAGSTFSQMRRGLPAELRSSSPPTLDGVAAVGRCLRSVSAMAASAD